MSDSAYESAVSNGDVPCDGAVARDTRNFRDFLLKVKHGQVNVTASALLVALHNLVTDAASKTYDKHGNPFIPAMRRTYYCPKAAIDRMRETIVFRNDTEVQSWTVPPVPTGEVVKGVPGFDRHYCAPEEENCPLKCPRT
jgi:hypothetical protein